MARNLNSYKAYILKWIGMYPIESQLNSWDFMMRKYNNLSMKEGTSFVPFSCLEVQPKSYWILNNFVIEYSIKSILKCFMKMGRATFFISLESPWWVGFNGHNFFFFWPKVWEILKFWVTFFFYWKLNRNSKFNFWWKIKIGLSHVRMQHAKDKHQLWCPLSHL
jgi:hypothetical protein